MSKLAWVGVGMLVMWAGCRKGGESGLGTAELVITSPSTGAHVRGSVTVEVASSGVIPDKVTLLVDGGTVAETAVQPYVLSWDTGDAGEGAYAVTAQGLKEGVNWLSAPIEVTVDRTPPRLISKTMPADLAQPSVLTFSEPVLVDSLLDGGMGFSACEQATPEYCPQVSYSIGTGAADPASVHLQLTADVQPPAVLNIQIHSVTDLAGNSAQIDATYDWSWSVDPWLPVITAWDTGTANFSAVSSDSTVSLIAQAPTSSFDFFTLQGQQWVAGPSLQGPDFQARLVSVATAGSGLAAAAVADGIGTLHIYQAPAGQPWTEVASPPSGLNQNHDEPTGRLPLVIAMNSSGHILLAILDNYNDDNGPENEGVVRAALWNGQSWRMLLNIPVRQAFEVGQAVLLSDDSAAFSTYDTSGPLGVVLVSDASGNVWSEAFSVEGRISGLVRAGSAFYAAWSKDAGGCAISPWTPGTTVGTSDGTSVGCGNLVYGTPAGDVYMMVPGQSSGPNLIQRLRGGAWTTVGNTSSSGVSALVPDALGRPVLVSWSTSGSNLELNELP